METEDIISLDSMQIAIEDIERICDIASNNESKLTQLQVINILRHFKPRLTIHNGPGLVSIIEARSKSGYPSTS